MTKRTVVTALALSMWSVSALAVSLGTDITYFDNRVDSNADPVLNDWWNGGTPDPRVNGGLSVGEDQEVEPSAAPGQSFDLEGVYLTDAGILSLVGGYDFANGVGGYLSGDIFIDIDPTFAPTNTPGSVEPPNPTGAGYEYVIDITPAAGSGLLATYNVYAISGLTVGSGLLGATSLAAEPVLQESNPWRLDDTYIPNLQLVASGALTLTGYASDAALAAAYDNYATDYVPVGDQHYVLSGFDLSSFLNLDTTTLYIHNTMQCGNDVLTGFVPVPEPSTYALLGLGLAAAAAKRRFCKVS
ncbi:MAG: PEP-CTERM sorting domain-containing protein [Candidatus Hydrogenedentes bacterium]|nr:PEP-CTERM sorting domain-containing protein [Candidatus Hydrogenedentota bacterium]